MLPTMISLFTSFANILISLLPLLQILMGWLGNIMNFIAPILSGLSGITSSTGAIGSVAGATGGTTSTSSGGIGGFFSGIIHGISGFFSSLFGGGKAAGGPVMAGRSYLVGEHGPEILRMGGSGFITPNAVMGGNHYHQVTVKIGETELQNMVTSQISMMTQGVAVAARMGRGSIV
jgi:hypothetical protein